MPDARCPGLTTNLYHLYHKPVLQDDIQRAPSRQREVGPRFTADDFVHVDLLYQFTNKENIKIADQSEFYVTASENLDHDDVNDVNQMEIDDDRDNATLVKEIISIVSNNNLFAVIENFNGTDLDKIRRYSRAIEKSIADDGTSSANGAILAHINDTVLKPRLDKERGIAALKDAMSATTNTNKVTEMLRAFLKKVGSWGVPLNGTHHTPVHTPVHTLSHPFTNLHTHTFTPFHT